MTSVPPIALLGTVERWAYVEDGHKSLVKMNMIGLKSHIISFIYPLNLCDHTFLFAVYAGADAEAYDLILRDEQGAVVGNLRVQLNPYPIGYEPPASERLISSTASTIPVPIEGWALLPTRFPSTSPIIIRGPLVCKLFVKLDEKEIGCGGLVFGLATAPPLSPERKAAIRSMSEAAGSMRYLISCRKCSSSLMIYSALERSPKLEAEGHIWQHECPDVFECMCGQASFDITSVRQNLHVFLGNRPGAAGLWT